MNKTLNIVNGDASVGIMKEAGIEGEFLPWRDFLHEGPVPQNLTLQQLSKVRANFIVNLKFGEFKEVHHDFQERDKKLNAYQLFDKVVLWFEHDLYDQLQLIQILSWFNKQNLENIELTLISTNNYFGESSAQQIRKLLHYETKVLPEHLELASLAWSAFCQPSPLAWFKLLKKPTSLLPFLKGAIFRMLEEYPNTKNGLSRTEYQALLIIANGIQDPVDIFTKYQSFEERKFMGDIIFFKILDEFSQYKIIERNSRGEEIRITELGKNLLEGRTSWVNIKKLDRYIGGVHLNSNNLWCWDVKNKNIKRYFYSKALNTLLMVK